MLTAKHLLVLLFASMVMFSNYYCYDIPGSINTLLRDHLKSSYALWQYQLNLLYSVYSMPNIFLPLIGGLLVDKLGANRMLIVFSTFICIGTALFAYGVSIREFPVMVFGRIIFGLGGESLEVAQTQIMTEWFRGRGLATAHGFNLSFMRIATALNDNISPYFAQRNVSHAPWFAFIVCLVSFASCLVVVYLNRSKNRLEAGVDTEESAPLLNGHDTATQQPPVLVDNENASIDYDEEDENVHLSQIQGLSRTFWLLCIIAICLYGAVVPFFHICTDFFQHKWYPGDPQRAGLVMSVPDIISAVLSPFCGAIVDRWGRRPSIMLFSSVLLFLSHALFCFTSVTPVFSISLMGLSYTIFAAALWPCIPYLVGRHQIATAYGLVTVALNISLFSFPLVVAKIRNLHSEDFTYVEYFFLFMSTLGIIATALLRFGDSQGPKLELSAKNLKSLEEMHSEDEPDASDEDDDLTVKVVAEGVSVPVPHTYIHHHHHGTWTDSEREELDKKVKSKRIRFGSPSHQS